MPAAAPGEKESCGSLLDPEVMVRDVAERWLRLLFVAPSYLEHPLAIRLGTLAHFVLPQLSLSLARPTPPPPCPRHPGAIGPKAQDPPHFSNCAFFSKVTL